MSPADVARVSREAALSMRVRFAQATLHDYLTGELPKALESEFLAGALTDVLAVLRERAQDDG